MGDSRLDMNPILFDEILNIFAGSENTDAGRAYGVYEPNPEFLSNIEGYLHNRFLNIGIFTSLKCQSFIKLCIFVEGLYPHYLWLFKEFLPLLKETIIFQGKINRDNLWIVSQ